MNDFITQAEYNEIKLLVEGAIQAYSKATAKQYIDKLSFKKSDFCGYTAVLFATLVNSVIRASGKVADKDRLVQFVFEDLKKLERRIEQ